jgi:hypothetical protein
MTRARDLSKLLGTNNNGVIDNTNITLDANEIPNLDTAKITTGTFADARISAGSVSQHVDLSNLNASNLTSGTIASARINNSSLSAISALPAGVGGKVLQVVNATDSTIRSTTSTSYVTASNTLSVNITPSFTSSKIFIIVNSSAYKIGNSTSFALFKNASILSFMAIIGTGGVDPIIPFAFSYLDSPSSTSTLTYQLYFKSNNGGAVYLNSNDVVGSITAFEIAG